MISEFTNIYQYYKNIFKCLKYLQGIVSSFTFVLSNYKKERSLKRLQTFCRVVKQADTPPCLGGGELWENAGFGTNHSMKVRFLPLQH